MRKRIREQARKDGCVCVRERERERERERGRERCRGTQYMHAFLLSSIIVG